MEFSTAIVTLTFLSRFNGCFSTDSNYQSWTPKFANRSNMKCPQDCDKKNDGLVKGKEHCCVCDGQPSWKVPEDETKPLLVEYKRRNGLAELYRSEYNTSSLLYVDHSYGFLSRIPLNVCDFPNLVKIRLTRNLISEIGNISCLSYLDTLDLSHNYIKYIGNKTFVGLSNLRVLTVAYNGLTTLEPSAITGESLQIFHADFSNNNMTNIEFRNMISDHDFCKLDFSSNNIEKIVNSNHFKIDTKKAYEGGRVELTNNQFTKFIDFQELGITDIRVLGKVLSYGFVMPDVKWDCDCHMEPYLELAEDVIKRIWRDYFYITCYNPPEYRGRTIPELVNNGHLDIFICNLTAKEKCPPQCRCFYQPKERRTVVNCSNAGLTTLPKYLPDGNNITLLLTNNSIEHFGDREYIKNVSLLDFSNNQLKTIATEAIESLRKDVSINLVNNSLKTLPRATQTLNPCKSNFGSLTIECGCNDLWIKDWMDNQRTEQCSNSTVYMCQTKDGLIPANKISKELLCEVENSSLVPIVLSILCILIVAIASVLYFFRYEMYLLKRRYTFWNLKNKVHSQPKYDVFLSFNDENEEARIWVLNVLVKILETAGYRLFVPCRDLHIGTVREEELLEKILCSRNYIVLLCNYYKDSVSPWTDIEWKYIWNSFTDQFLRKIIVINFDQLDSADEMDPKLRAFVRLGYDIDFSNRNHHLITEVKERLGSPYIANFYNINKKPKFLCENLRKNKYVTDKVQSYKDKKISVCEQNQSIDINPEDLNLQFNDLDYKWY